MVRLAQNAFNKRAHRKGREDTAAQILSVCGAIRIDLHIRRVLVNCGEYNITELDTKYLDIKQRDFMIVGKLLTTLGREPGKDGTKVEGAGGDTRIHGCVSTF